MFGMGMGELLLILVVALLVVGPDKLPQAAKTIGKGIRDFRRHSQELQSTLEQDEKLGEAVRELRSALRDDPLRPLRSPRTLFDKLVPPTPAVDPVTGAPAELATGGMSEAAAAAAAAGSIASTDLSPASASAAGDPAAASSTDSPATTSTDSTGAATTEASSAGSAAEAGPPRIFPAPGAVARRSPETRPPAEPAARSKPDDPAHG
jgi:sec-independent protein translocase protein TatB